MPLRVGTKNSRTDFGVAGHIPQLIIAVGGRRRQIEDLDDPLALCRVPEEFGAGLWRCLTAQCNNTRGGRDDAIELILYLLKPLRDDLALAAQLAILPEEKHTSGSQKKRCCQRKPL